MLISQKSQKISLSIINFFDKTMVLVRSIYFKEETSLNLYINLIFLNIHFKKLLCFYSEMRSVSTTKLEKSVAYIIYISVF